MRPRFRLLAIGMTLAFALGGAAPAAFASEALTDVNIELRRFAVNAKGEALVSYTTAEGKTRNVLAWAGINANAPDDPAIAQVRFRFDYAGGWGKYRKAGYWKSVRNACGRYTGQPLPYLVTACTAPDGSHWALQSWQRLQPLLGFEPWLPKHTAWEFHLSHWSTELPKLELYSHWTYGGQWQGVFGRLTYLGKPVHGFGSNNVGNPKDRYGRNVYLDTLDSAYGPGWKREAGILAHRPSGTFCHSFVPQAGFPGYPSQGIRPPAPGSKYRATVMGPGVTPVIQMEIPGATAAFRATSSNIRDVWDSVMQGDTICERERSA
jgi:hypothetical protein